MDMKKMGTALLTGVLAASLLAGCGSSQKEAGDANKPLRVATNATFVPFEFKDSDQGLVLNTDLQKLSPGFHGFHIHEKGSCEPAEKDGKMGAALAAGGHFNPQQAPHHGTPNDGHLGDLPVLNVDSQGVAKTTVVAPRLKLADVKGLAIMVHAGGDNYSDSPKPLGGGGDRVACGVIN